MTIRTVGIIGYGAFGALAHKILSRFAANVTVRVYSHTAKPDGKLFLPLKDVAASDAVILAVPISAFEEVLGKIVPLARPDTIFVDISTVKMHTTAILERLAKGRPFIASHPMWGPESYEKRGGDVSGFRIIVTKQTLPTETFNELRTFLTSIGFDIVEMSPDEHDKHLAESLFLTHFIGQLVTRGGFERTEIDTVSFGFLMDAVESVKNDEALFRDVFRYNPYCKDVLSRITNADGEVRAFLAGGEERKVGGFTIGISGAKGSFSEEAALTYAQKENIGKFEMKYLISVENVLSALEAGPIDIGIFPIENSTGGVVLEAVDAMAKHNFKKKAMFDIDIRQNLLARKGTKAEAVTAIASHDQALRQCREYLAKKWPNVQLQEYADTAKAAEDLAAGKLPATTAVIASRAAAEVYGLQVIEESIQDLKENFTSFIAAERA